MSFKTFHIIVKGAVQGVGFRAMAKHYADKLEIGGSVRNLSDGSVEIYIQGVEKKCDQFIEYLKSDKSFSKVKHISIDDYPNSKKYPAFEILF